MGDIVVNGTPYRYICPLCLAVSQDLQGRYTDVRQEINMERFMEMAKTKLMAAAACLLLSLPGAYAQSFNFEWDQVKADASRTGVSAPNAGNLDTALGRRKGRKYIAPNGRRFKKGSTPEVAGIVIDAQDKMAEVYEVIGNASHDMVKAYPESELSNWFVDHLMEAVEQRTGKKVDVGIANFGGIRTDFYEGPILKDDVLSMFPFKNYICYVALKGSDLKYWFDFMAENGIQVVGGVNLVVKDHKLVEAKIGGEPLDEDKVYGLATIDFILEGGDGLSLARNAVELIQCDERIIDVMLPYVRKITAEGKNVEYKTDGRVKIL